VIQKALFAPGMIDNKPLGIENMMEVEKCSLTLQWTRKNHYHLASKFHVTPVLNKDFKPFTTLGVEQKNCCNAFLLAFYLF
jgi:hypothetical protein